MIKMRAATAQTHTGIFEKKPELVGVAGLFAGPPSVIGYGPDIALYTWSFAATFNDYLFGAWRIVFAAFFVGCFIIRRVIHRPLSRLGFTWLTSGKPIFTTLFAAIGAGVATLQHAV